MSATISAPLANTITRLAENEQALQRMIGIGLTLQRDAALPTISQVMAAQLGPLQRTLGLVRAAQRHLQQQARVTGRELCPICGAVDHADTKVGGTICIQRAREVGAT